MGYTVLARTLRPKLFDDLVGQESIVRILKNTISEKRIAHAYLFSGPRGVGKTSSARILARAVNCSNISVDNPCNVCPNCKSSLEGSSIDVIEIDGASNNSVDDIRDLRETVKYAPSGAKYKVYIIDEAHMLSASAFNALLKTLEEPPPHVIFILATTAPSKILTTVLSRCQHLPFRRISSEDIEHRIRSISESEGIKITPEALKLISVAADGSMRDSLTLLDQICSFSTDITESDVRAMLGISDDTPIMSMAQSLINGDRLMIIKIIEQLYESGIELRNFISELVKYIRDVLVTKITLKDDALVGYNERKVKEIKELADSNSAETLTVLLNELINAEALVRGANSQRIALEMSLIRVSFINVIRPINEIIDELKSFKGGISLEKVPKNIEDVKKIKSPNIIEKRLENKIEEHCSIENELDNSPKLVDEPEITSLHPKINIESNDFGRLWSLVLESLESSDYKLWCKLNDKKAEVDDKCVNITFPEKDIHFDSVSKQKKSIQDIIKRLTGSELAVNIIKKKGESLENVVPTTRNKNMEEALSDPIIIDALDLFDGRIVTVKTRDKAGR
ncbi:MAG: DNA polymerase III subunit gamma/tau [Nitrospirae bacterium]|nr:DNA polymerase III subunit gamma/tau [Nitrospirota bacterium]MBF0542048.1 DNA polymerase III subunit gamma/tau [Nitrospirota bacterium]